MYAKGKVIGSVIVIVTFHQVTKFICDIYENHAHAYHMYVKGVFMHCHLYYHEQVLYNHCNKSKISYTFVPKEMCRKHYIIEQISGSLHEIQLYNVHLIYIS